MSKKETISIWRIISWIAFATPFMVIAGLFLYTALYPPDYASPRSGGMGNIGYALVFLLYATAIIVPPLLISMVTNTIDFFKVRKYYPGKNVVGWRFLEALLLITPGFLICLSVLIYTVISLPEIYRDYRTEKKITYLQPYLEKIKNSDRASIKDLKDALEKIEEADLPLRELSALEWPLKDTKLRLAQAKTIELNKTALKINNKKIENFSFCLIDSGLQGINTDWRIISISNPDMGPLDIIVQEHSLAQGQTDDKGCSKLKNHENENLNKALKQGHTFVFIAYSKVTFLKAVENNNIIILETDERLPADHQIIAQ